MEKGKKFYLKPQMGIMNVQTEGVIAASGDSGTIPWKEFCFSGCLDGSELCSCTNATKKPNCQHLEVGETYKATLHCNPSNTSGGDFPDKVSIHFVLSDRGMISYWPCDNK